MSKGVLKVTVLKPGPAQALDIKPAALPQQKICCLLCGAPSCHDSDPVPLMEINSERQPIRPAHNSGRSRRHRRPRRAERRSGRPRSCGWQSPRRTGRCHRYSRARESRPDHRPDASSHFRQRDRPASQSNGPERSGIGYSEASASTTSKSVRQTYRRMHALLRALDLVPSASLL